MTREKSEKGKNMNFCHSTLHEKNENFIDGIEGNYDVYYMMSL